MTEIVLRELNISQVHEAPWNPRKHFDEAALQELAASIAEKGVLLPVLVRTKTTGTDSTTFEIVAGARRLRAAKIAKLLTIPSIVRQLSDVEALEVAVVENEQREDVNPMEQAEGYQRLLKAGKGYTAASLARRLGKTESFVIRRVKLLGLEPALQTALAEGRLSLGHAEMFLRLSPALQKQAGSLDGSGVVWSRSPLLDQGDKWIPTADDLLPLSRLEEFIRQKSQFYPATADAPHLVPGYREQLALAESADARHGAEDPTADLNEEPVAATLLELTFDSMARARMGAKATDPIPLTPSKWREVKPGRACAFMQRGVITQGTERYAEILNVCLKRSCQKHWPVKPRPAATKAPKTTTPAAPVESYDERRKREFAANQALLDKAMPLLAKHTAKTKFSAALVRTLLDEHDLKEVQANFGVALTNTTAAQVLLLNYLQVNAHYLEPFRRDCKALKFDLAAVERDMKKQATAEAKAKAKPAVAKTATTAPKKGKAIA